MDNWTKFRKLSLEERQILIQALLLLPIVHLLLRLFGYTRLNRFIKKKIVPISISSNLSQTDSIGKAKAAGRMISVAATYGLYRASCLRRSLTLVILLQRRGIQNNLCFGTRKTNHGLEAHAWVEVDGEVVNDQPDIRKQFIFLDDTNATGQDYL